MIIPEYFEFQDRTKIVFALDAIDEVGKEAAKIGAKKIMYVTGSTARKLGFLDRMEAALKEQKIDVVATFDGIPENSEAEFVEKGRTMAEESGADMIITIGGGSILDTAKGINVLFSLGGNLLDDYQGANLITQPLKPMIAIPTTAGSASEVTFAAVILDKSENMKLAFLSPYMAPSVAILDPKVTVSMPPKLTASTGMDALTHAIEAMHSTSRTPISNALSVYAIKMIMDNLKEATDNGENLDARSNMLIASTIAGLSFSNALVGIVHALAHAAGGIAHVPHGIANSIFLPHGMEFNLESCPDVYAEVAQAMGLDVAGLSDIDAGRKAIEAVAQLTKDIGLPQKLSEVGVKEDQLETIAEFTLMDGSLVTNPREAFDPEEFLGILKKAF